MIHTLHQLAKKDLFSRKGKLVTGVLSLTIGVATCLLLLAIVLSAKHIATATLSTTTGEDELKIVPKYSLGFFKVTKQEQRKIDQDAVDELKNLAGVKEVRTEEVLQIPSSLEVSLFGTRFVTDSPIYAVEDSYFEQEKQYTADPSIIPVLISKELVDIYNIGIASAINKPAINEDILQGFEMDIRLGTSSFGEGYDGEKVSKKARVVGIVKHIPIIGITMPQSALHDLHTTYLSTYNQPLYSRAFVSIIPGTNTEQLIHQIETLGFEATSNAEEKMRVQNAFSSIELFFYLLVGVIMSLVVLSFTQFFYTHRTEKAWLLSLLSALGGSQQELRRFFLVQVGYFAMLGIIPGTLLGAGSVYALNMILESTLHDYLSLTPILTLPPLEGILVIIFLTLLLILLALHPASLAAKARPEDGVL